MEQPNNENKKVQYYSEGQFSDSNQFDNMQGEARIRRSFPTWAKALIIIVAIIFGIVILGAGCSSMLSDITGTGISDEVTTNFGHEYIGVLYVQDTIDESSAGVYNHQYLLNAIDAMIYDDDNKGMILYVNTPGGSVYASDELYLKIKEYQDQTGRPVYSSMQSQATSGGYYISASCDKIIANRNCWTGSIGVTMGSFVDISGLLNNLGIKTTTITSGANKAMGSTVEPMTDEQRSILQSLVDEAYEQFVSIVAEGRGLSVDYVKQLADGRIYSAQQAVDNGLVDQVGTYEDAVNDMISSYDLGDVSVEPFQPEVANSLASLFGEAQENKSESITDAAAIEELLKLNGTFKLSYLCTVVR